MPKKVQLPTEALVRVRKYSIPKRGFVDLKNEWMKIIKFTIKRITLADGYRYDRETLERVGLQTMYRRNITRLR